MLCLFLLLRLQPFAGACSHSPGQRLRDASLVKFLPRYLKQKDFESRELARLDGACDELSAYGEFSSFSFRVPPLSSFILQLTVVRG